MGGVPGPSRHVALLRGVNVGGKNRVPMEELRTLFETLGHAGVATYIQSGNVVFEATAPVLPDGFEEAIAEHFGVRSAVVVVEAAELRRVISDNPFGDVQPTTLHVGFMNRVPEERVVEGLERAGFLPDEFSLGGRALYLHLPNGMGRTKLPAYLDRKLKIPITYRNWNTVNRLLEMTSG